MDIKYRRAILSITIGALIVSCNSKLSSSDYLDKAHSYLEQGKFSAATIETRNAVKDDPENGNARLLLGSLLLQSGDAAGAEKELRKARELGVQDDETRPMLASVLLAQGKLDELLALSPDGLESEDAAQLLASRAMGWFASDEIPNARLDVQQALQLNPFSADSMLALARFDAAENDLVSATDGVNALLESSPMHGAAWEFLGDLERFANRPEKALEAYKKSIENSVNPLSALLKRAQINVQLGHTTGAVTDLDTLANAGVKLPEIHLARGQLKLREGDLLGAQGNFEEALTMSPDYTPALGSLALTHLLLGNLGQAEQYSKQLLTESNASYQARRLLAAVYLESGRFNPVEDTIKPVIDSGNSDLSSIRLLGTALLKQGRYDDAVALMVDFLRVAQVISSDNAGKQNSPVLIRLPSQELYEETVTSPTESSTPLNASAVPLLSDKELLFVSAVEHLEKGNWVDATTAAEKLRTAMPESTAPLNLLGRIYLASDNVNDASNTLEAVIKLEPGNSTANQLLSAIDFSAGDLDAARSHLEKVVQSGTPTEAVFVQLSRIEAQAGNESAMLDWIEKARSAYPDSAASALMLARYHVAKRDPENALNILSGLDENARNRPDVLQLEGASLILQERFVEALPKLEQLVQSLPEVAQWRYMLAISKSGTGNNPGAIEELNKALKIDPSHTPSQLALANADIQQGRLDKAFTHVEALRELIPGSYELEQIEARYEARKAEPVNSATSNDTNSGTTIDSTEMLLATARQLWTDNEREKAIALLNAWLEANSEDFTARLTLANSYVALEQTDAAVQQYETVLAVGEENLPAEAQLVALNNLAWYLRETDSDRAVNYAQRAVDAAPESVAALDTLAMIHLARDDAPAAKSAFDKATEMGVEDPTILYHGATIENALGNTEIARSILQPLVEGSVEFPEAEEAARLYQELQ